MGSITDKLERLIETKKLIKDAITTKGVEVLDTDKFSVYPDKILKISNGGIGENLLAGTYAENVINGINGNDYIASGNITTVTCSVKSVFINPTNRDVSDVLPTLKTQFDNNLSYNTEIATINEVSILKLYKGNSQNAFLMFCELAEGAQALIITVKVMINGIISNDVIYQRRVSQFTSSYFCFTLNFVKTARGEIWGIGELITDLYNADKPLYATSVIAKNMATNEETYLHCLSDSNSENGTSFLKFSDNSADFTNSLTEKTVEYEHLINSDYVILEYLYFYSENLKTDNLFVTKVFPNRYTSMSFELKGNLFCSSCCGNDTNVINSRFVFLIN